MNLSLTAEPFLKGLFEKSLLILPQKLLVRTHAEITTALCDHFGLMTYDAFVFPDGSG